MKSSFPANKFVSSLSQRVPLDRRARLFSGGLHHRDIVVHELVAPLQNVHPVVTAYQVGFLHLWRIPRINRQTGQEKRIILPMGTADYVGNSILEALILQRVSDVSGEIPVFLQKREMVRERFHCGAKLLFNGFENPSS